jgi:hypothetical protein
MRSRSGIPSPDAEPGQRVPICRRSGPGEHGHVSPAQGVARLGTKRIDSSRNQYGDYEGLVSFSGVSQPIWTDTRGNLAPLLGCRQKLTMDEVLSATVRNLSPRPRRSRAFRARHSRTRRVTRLAAPAPLGSNRDRPREPGVLRQGWGMKGAVVAVCARRGEHKLIRPSGGPSTIRAAAARRAEGPAVPDASVAGGRMLRGAVVRPLNRRTNLDRQ